MNYNQGTNAMFSEQKGKCEIPRGDTHVEERFLIVDDEPMIRKMIRRVLEKENYLVVGEASDGNEAVTLASMLKPDVVIMDNVMKEMHGIEATRQIIENSPETRVIIMTGEPRPSLVGDCFKAGASNFMIKPFDMQSLLLALRNIRNARTRGGAKSLACCS